MPAARLAVLLIGLLGAEAHPMHTALTELVQRDAAGATAVEIRVFADDFQSAVRLPADPAAADSAMARYLRGTFALADRAGHPVRLSWTGAERSGDVIRMRLDGRVAGGLAGARVISTVLCERFEGQVNVVRAAYAGRTETLLFTRGEWSKPLP